MMLCGRATGDQNESLVLEFFVELCVKVLLLQLLSLLAQLKHEVFFVSRV
jgi:hypothetical protein